MAIQFRRGQFSKFDPSRLLPGEPAVVTSGDTSVTDGKALYMCFAAGDVKRMATYDDMDADVRNIFDEEFGPEVEQATAAAQQAATTANSAAYTAQTAASTAQTAAETASVVATDSEERINAAIEAVGEISELAVPLMSADTRGGATLGNGLALDGGALGVGSLAKATDGAIFGPLASVAATGWAEQDGIPTPSAPVPITCAGGRNLLQGFVANGTYNSSTGEEQSTGASTYCRTGKVAVSPSSSYTFSVTKSKTGSGLYMLEWAQNGTFVGQTALYGTATTHHVVTFMTGATTGYVAFMCGASSAAEQVGTVTDAQLERGSTAHGYVPYGYVGLDAKGKNLAQPNQAVVSGIDSGVTWTNLGNGLWELDGTNSASTAKAKSYKMYDCGVLASGTYTVTVERVSGTSVKSIIPRIGTGNDATIFNSFTTVESSAARSVRTFTADGSTQFWLCIQISGNDVLSDAVFRLQLEPGSTATKYVPYYDSTAAVPMPPSGYAAALPDGTADELTIDAAGHVTWVQREWKVVLDGTEDWTLRKDGGNDRNFEYLNSGYPNPSTGTTNTTDGHALSNITLAFGNPEAAANIGRNNVWVFSSTTASFRIGGPFNLSMSLADWKSWLQSNPVTVYYPLATPITHDLGYIDMPPAYGEGTASIAELDGFEVKSWVDEDGSIHALAEAYHARTLAEVNDALGIVAPIEGATASTNYSVGGYLVRDGQLCRVTSAIATGESIAIGTNVTATTAMAEVLALTS